MLTPAVHPAIRRQLRQGTTTVAEIQAAADHLADLMISVHGGAWSININHDTCFVIVARDFSDADEPVDMSNNGEN